jgi:radical SAM superfamily enzyme YgiQ (UPF0313 family)
MRIALVEVANKREHIWSKFDLPRLGLLYLGSYVKKINPELDLRVFYGDLSSSDYDYIFSSDLVGISTITSTVPAAYRLAEELKKRDIVTVLGGPHVTFLPEEAVMYSPICVRNEGEYSFAKLVSLLKEEKSLSIKALKEISGLSFRVNGEIYHTPDSEFISDLDSLPFLDFSLLNRNYLEKEKVLLMLTTRGCPHRCEFCSVTTLLGHKYRCRSIDNVMEELKLHLPRTVLFYDDNFTAVPQRTKALLESIIRANLKLRWMAQVGVDVYKDKELLKLMKRSGCYRLYIGMESLDLASLQEYKKKHTPQEVEECIIHLKEKKIKVHAMFIYGSDNDSPSSLNKILKFVKKYMLDSVQIMILTPLPGSFLYNLWDSQDRIFTKDWGLYDGHHVVYYPNSTSPYQLQKLVVKAMKKIYSISSFFSFLLSGKFEESIFRLIGNFIIKRWSKDNKHFFTFLKNLMRK